MSLMTSRAPRRTLAEHPEFAMMVARTLDRYHCTIAEIREDYWVGRAWRALAGDPALEACVARLGVGSVLVTGPDFGAAVPGSRERSRLRTAVLSRLEIDTGHTADELGLAIRFAEAPVSTAEGCMLSLIAQTVIGSGQWLDLASYAGDIAPVIVPVAFSMEAVVAA